MFEQAEGPAASIVKNRRGSGLTADRRKTSGGEVQRLVPRNRLESSVCPQKRRRHAIRRILSGKEKARAVAEKASRDRMLPVASNPRHPPVLDRRDNRARVGAIAVTYGFATFLHGSD